MESSLQQTVGQAPGTAYHTGRTEAFWSAMASPNNTSFFASLAGDPEQPLPALRHDLRTPLALAAVEVDGASFLEALFWKPKQ